MADLVRSLNLPVPLYALALMAYASAYLLAAFHRRHLLRGRRDWPLGAVQAETALAGVGAVAAVAGLAAQIAGLAP